GFFLAAGFFFAAVFLAAGFLAVFLAADLAAGFFVAIFFAMGSPSWEMGQTVPRVLINRAPGVPASPGPIPAGRHEGALSLDRAVVDVASVSCAGNSPGPTTFTCGPPAP